MLLTALTVSLGAFAFAGLSFMTVVGLSYALYRVHRRQKLMLQATEGVDLTEVKTVRVSDPVESGKTQSHRMVAAAAPPAHSMVFDYKQPKTHKHKQNTAKPPALVLNSDSDSLAEDVGPEVEAKAQTQDHTQMDAGRAGGVAAGGGGDGHCCLPWWHNANEASTQAEYPKQKPSITTTSSARSVMQQPKGLSGVKTCAAYPKCSAHHQAPNSAAGEWVIGSTRRSLQFVNAGDVSQAPPPVKRYKLMGVR